MTTDQQQLALGLALRDQGIDDCIAASESVLRENFTLAAKQALNDLAETGQEFTADDVRRQIPDDLEAHSPNLLPALFGEWSTKGRIKTVGYRQSPRKSRRGGLIRVWVGVKKEAELLPAC